MWLLTKPFEIAYRALMRFIAHDGLIYSSHIAYTALFAFFPFVMVIVTLTAYVGPSDTAAQFTSTVLDYFPDAVKKTLAPITAEMLTQRRGGLLTVSLVMALWVASSGIEALRAGLDRAFDNSHSRPTWYTRAHALLVVVASVLLISAVGFLIVVGPLVRSFVLPLIDWPAGHPIVWSLGRYGISTSVLFLVIITLYRWLPSRMPALREIWPGALVATVLWLSAATLFGLYLLHFPDYAVLYGSLGGAIITLVFLYLSGAVFIYGAEINAVCHDRKITA